MPRDPRYDILFEPVQIGPRTARNRFYQVPHCNGLGYLHGSAMATMRGIKAEGGWAVVNTEQCEIHPSADSSPLVELRLWDDRDLPVLQLMAQKVQENGALAGVELTYNSYAMASLYTREIPLAPSHLPVQTSRHDPVQARSMDKDDIANFRRWHRNAAERAVKAGFDVIYVYSAHNLSVLFHFLSKRWNHRDDEYGGSLENRVRLLREVMEDTHDVVAGRAALGVRISLDELVGNKGLEKNEAEDAIGMLAELPDLWDVTLSDWSNDSQTSRFAPEAAEEPFVNRIKTLTTKPVVGVGRFTSPDTMVSQIRRGILDFIGAARPSIADPFLPKKIEEGRIDEIRECIGCNICVAHDELSVPIRCTQNPTQGEEWRKGWHPERASAAGADRRCRSRRSRGSQPPVAARLCGDACRCEPRARRAGGARGPAAGHGDLGPCRRAPQDADRAAAQCRNLSRQRARRRQRAGLRFRPGGDRDRVELAARRDRALSPACGTGARRGLGPDPR